MVRREVGELVFVAGFQVKKMNCMRTPSAYQSLQTWRAKRQAAVQDFQTASSLASNAFASVASNQISGSGELAANAAMKRITAEGKAKLAATIASLDMKA